MSALARIFAGDRRVWISAAVAGLVFGAVGCYYVTRDDYPEFLGTNSVDVRSFVLTVRDGQAICLPDLSVPAGTAAVRVVAAPGAHPALGWKLALPAGPIRGSLPAGSGRGVVDLPVPPPERPASRSTGTLCLTPRDAPLTLGGMAGVYHGVDRGEPVLGGRPVDATRVAVWFMPEQRSGSLLGSLGTITDRAALFRPGPVGPWLYYLLLLLVPLTWFAAIRTLALTAAGGSSRGAAIGTIAAITFANACIWALINPVFNAPDEPDHVAYSQHLAETGDPPVRGSSDLAPFADEQTEVLDGMRIFSWTSLPNGRPPWLQSDEQALDRALDGSDPSRSNGGGALSTSTHSPLYYSLTVPAYKLGSGGTLITRVTLMRFVSALLGALAGALIFLIVLELFPGQRFAAAAAGLLVAFQPMFTFMSGAVNNDPGVDAAAALLVYLLVRGLRRGLTVRLAIGLGLALVLAPLAKGTALALYPAAAIALAGMLWRRHSRADLPAYGALAGTFFAGLALWSVIAAGMDRGLFTTPQGTSPAASGGIGGNVLSDPTGFASYIWQVFLPKLPFMTDLHPQRWPAFDIYVERGWAAFGWYVAEFPHWTYLVITAAMLTFGALCCVAVWRERVAARARWLELVVLIAVLGGVVAGVEAAYFTPDGGRTVVAEQGRYAFTALAALAPIAVGGCYAFGRRAAIPIASVLVSSVMALCAASFLLTMGWFFS